MRSEYAGTELSGDLQGRQNRIGKCGGYYFQQIRGLLVFAEERVLVDRGGFTQLPSEGPPAQALLRH